MKELFDKYFPDLENWVSVACIVIIKVLIVFVLYLIIRKICFAILDKWKDKTQKISDNLNDKGIDASVSAARIVTLSSILKSLIGFVLAFVSILMALSFFGLDISPLLATAGVAGLAIGFGAQKIVKDVVTGILILLENQYFVGERITTAGFTGEVIELGIRTTTIKGDDGEIYIISNGDIDKVVNYSRGYNNN